LKISTGGMGVTASSLFNAATIPSGPPALELIINATDGIIASKENTDGNYYNIIFPDDYIGVRGVFATDPFIDARSGVGAIDWAGNSTYSSTLNIVFNIPTEMSIGGNTSGNYGRQTVGGAGSFAGAKYELTMNWDSGWISGGGAAAHGQYLSDPSLVINLDTDEWNTTTLGNLNVTINNSGNTIGAGGSGGYGGRYKVGGGGGGGGQGLCPVWPGGTSNEFDDNFVSGEMLAGQGGGGYREGGTGGGIVGIQGTIAGGGGGGNKGGVDAGTGHGAAFNLPQAGHVGGTVIYVNSDVASPVTTNINIVNKSTGRMYGGGGGGAGGKSVDGGDGGSMLTPGTSGETAHDAISGVTVQGGWQGSILWVDSTNLTVSNTITNENSTNPIVGWDGSWTT
jgi:hypothetical protein